LTESTEVISPCRANQPTFECCFFLDLRGNIRRGRLPRR
jgi:hypothetical protein